jgi:hypothetical protein
MRGGVVVNLMRKECKICGERVNLLSSHLEAHNISIVEYGRRYPEWAFFTTTLIEFRMTTNQLSEAITHKLVRTKDNLNTYNADPEPILVFTGDIAENYKKIKQFPRLSLADRRLRRAEGKRKHDEMIRLLGVHWSLGKEGALTSGECKVCGELVENLLAHLKKHGITVLEYGARYPDWIPFATALRNFDISQNQMLEAILARMVRTKSTPNASNTETETILVYTEDVSKNYKKIKQFPNLTKEERRHIRAFKGLLIAQREAEMDQLLTFYCPRCKENVEPFHGSTFGSAIRGEITPEDALESVKVSHYRHIHTNYESELFDLEKEVKKYYFDESSPLKYDYPSRQVMLEDYKNSIDYTAQKAEIKARYSEKAKRLIQKDFPPKNEPETTHSFEDNKS